MVKYINLILLLQTLLIVLILHLVHIIDQYSRVMYWVVFIVIYFLSICYFQLIIYLFKPRQKMNKKLEYLVRRILYLSFGLIFQIIIIIIIVKHHSSWGSLTLTFTGICYLVSALVVYLLCRGSMWVLSKVFVE